MIKKIISWFHIHRYNIYVVSRYVSFNYRDCIMECKCGKRRIEKEKLAEWVLPFIETCDTWQERNFEDYLTNGKYHVNSTTHNYLWKK